mmetsp:Transcript_98853/g.229057  ORF Transcript_98853/g.229057 Transcript_98853/m.229057 type:complete len:545 (+) Transcript_98853:93-1727(+)
MAFGLATVRSLADGALSVVRDPSLPRKDVIEEMDARTMVLFAVVLLCATAPLELSQVAFACIGALAYMLVQAVQVSPLKAAVITAKGKLGKYRLELGSGVDADACKVVPLSTGKRADLAYKSQHMTHAVGKQCYRQPSSHPITAPVFASSGFDGEVEELLGRVLLTAECDKVVQRLANIVKQVLRRSIPEIEVVGFACGELVRGTAFGVAVPEVDIVVSASPDVLASRLQSRLNLRSTGAQQLDARKLQKSAIRACTDRLVSSGNFKFRRSAFRGQEPKVTLLAPASLGIHTEAIPIDFSVNSSTPLYNAALFTECGQLEPRAKELITLIKRWAKDRGVCHAAKGHLSPYAWTLLAIYYLQVGVAEEGPLLPPLAGFEVSSRLAAGLSHPGPLGQPSDAPSRGAPAPRTAPSPGRSRSSVATLFRGFLHFYRHEFDWRDEVASVRLGQRGPPDLALPLHIVLHEDGITEVGLTIENPFDPRQNLGECTTAASLKRLREELARAEALCSGGRSLADLLQPWAPPERDGEEAPSGPSQRVAVRPKA